MNIDFDTAMKALQIFLLPLAGAVAATAYWLGKQSNFLVTVPRLQKTIEGDPEEKSDALKKMGLERRISMLADDCVETRAISVEYAKFTKALMHELNIPTASGELQMHQAIRSALGQLRATPVDDAETTGNRRQVILEQDQRFSPTAERPYVHDRNGTPVPPAPVPRPRLRSGPGHIPPMTEPPAPETRLKTGKPFDSRHSIVTGPHKVWRPPHDEDDIDDTPPPTAPDRRRPTK